MPSALVTQGVIVGLGALAWFVITQATTPAADKFVTDLIKDVTSPSKIPFFMVFVSFLITVLSKVPVLIAQSIEGKDGYDNKRPRDQQATLKGWGRRALAAHLNAFEAFPAFGLSVILAHITHVPLQVQINLTLLWGVCRVLYNIFYIVNIDALRTFVWFIAAFVDGRLFYLAATQ